MHREDAKNAKKDRHGPLRPLRLCGERIKVFKLNEYKLETFRGR